MQSDKKLFRFDQRFAVGGQRVLAGIDEAGRGPLAGPVVAAAVIFRCPLSLEGLNDSKKVSPRRREVLFKQIISQAWVGIGQASESVIDQLNIFQATRLAMREAVLALPRTPAFLLIDGRIRLDLPVPQLGIVRGDTQSAVIAAASIIAKVYRDHRMRELDKLFPGYGFARHKGYPTREHLRALETQGAASIHRKTFRPVAATSRGFRDE